VAGDESVSFTLKLTDAIDLNHFDLTLGASIANPSEMTVLLTSPSGTTITMVQTPPNTSTAWPAGGFRLGTDAFWGEQSEGDWTVRIDIVKDGTGGTIDSAIMTAYGDAHSTEKEFVYTDDFAKVIDADSWQQGAASRTELKVAAGETAVIDAAALSSGVLVDLAGHHAVILGETITIDSATKVTKIFTGDGNDTLRGDADDNALLAGRGTNTLDGGDGVDTALYIGSRAHYTASYSASGVFTVASADSADTAIHIEKASFEEGTLYVQAASNAGLDIAGLYTGLFFRDADGGGYRYWTIEASKGQSIGTIGASFLTSSEYTNGAGKLDNAAFVSGVYEHMLDRPADPGGAAYWIAALASGSVTRADMVLSIAHSTEYQQDELTGVFQSIGALGNLWG
jgi:subtilisin-like proprotein convertase family protein